MTSEAWCCCAVKWVEGAVDGDYSFVRKKTKTKKKHNSKEKRVSSLREHEMRAVHVGRQCRSLCNSSHTMDERTHTIGRIKRRAKAVIVDSPRMRWQQWVPIRSSPYWHKQQEIQSSVSVEIALCWQLDIQNCAGPLSDTWWCEVAVCHKWLAGDCAL